MSGVAERSGNERSEESEPKRLERLDDEGVRRTCACVAVVQAWPFSPSTSGGAGVGGCRLRSLHAALDHVQRKRRCLRPALSLFLGCGVSPPISGARWSRQRSRRHDALERESILFDCGRQGRGKSPRLEAVEGLGWLSALLVVGGSRVRHPPENWSLTV